MKSGEILKPLLSLPLAGAELLANLLPPDIRSEVGKAVAVVLKSVAEVAETFADRAVDGASAAGHVPANRRELRKVRID